MSGKAASVPRLGLGSVQAASSLASNRSGQHTGRSSRTPRRTPRELTGSTPRELGVQGSFKLGDIDDSDLSDDSLDSVRTPREPSSSHLSSVALRQLSPRVGSGPEQAFPESGVTGSKSSQPDAMVDAKLEVEPDIEKSEPNLSPNCETWEVVDSLHTESDPNANDLVIPPSSSQSDIQTLNMDSAASIAAPAQVAPGGGKAARVFSSALHEEIANAGESGAEQPSYTGTPDGGPRVGPTGSNLKPFTAAMSPLEEVDPPAAYPSRQTPDHSPTRADRAGGRSPTTHIIDSLLSDTVHDVLTPRGTRVPPSPSFGRGHSRSVPDTLPITPPSSSPSAASTQPSTVQPAIYSLTTDGEAAPAEPATQEDLSTNEVSPQVLSSLSNDSLPPTPPTAGKRDYADEPLPARPVPTLPRATPALEPEDAQAHTDVQASCPEESPLKRSSLSRGADLYEEAMGTIRRGVDYHAKKPTSSNSLPTQDQSGTSPSAKVAAEGNSGAVSPSNQEKSSDETTGYVAGAALGAAAAVAGAGTWLSGLVSGDKPSTDDEPAATEGEVADTVGSDGSSSGPRQLSVDTGSSNVVEPTAEVLMDRSKDLGSARPTEGRPPLGIAAEQLLAEVALEGPGAAGSPIPLAEDAPPMALFAVAAPTQLPSDNDPTSTFLEPTALAGESEQPLQEALREAPALPAASATSPSSPLIDIPMSNPWAATPEVEALPVTPPPSAALKALRPPADAAQAAPASLAFGSNVSAELPQPATKAAPGEEATAGIDGGNHHSPDVEATVPSGTKHRPMAESTQPTGELDLNPTIQITPFAAGEEQLRQPGDEYGEIPAAGSEFDAYGIDGPPAFSATPQRGIPGVSHDHLATGLPMTPAPSMARQFSGTGEGEGTRAPPSTPITGGYTPGAPPAIVPSTARPALPSSLRIMSPAPSVDAPQAPPSTPTESPKAAADAAAALCGTGSKLSRNSRQPPIADPEPPSLSEAATEAAEANAATKGGGYDTGGDPLPAVPIQQDLQPLGVGTQSADSVAVGDLPPPSTGARLSAFATSPATPLRRKLTRDDENSVHTPDPLNRSAATSPVVGVSYEALHLHSGNSEFMETPFRAHSFAGSATSTNSRRTSGVPPGVGTLRADDVMPEDLDLDSLTSASRLGATSVRELPPPSEADEDTANLRDLQGVGAATPPPAASGGMGTVDRKTRLPLVEETPADLEAAPWRHRDDAEAAAAVAAPLADHQFGSDTEPTGIVAGAVASAAATAGAAAAAAAAYLGYGDTSPSPTEDRAREPTGETSSGDFFDASAPTSFPESEHQNAAASNSQAMSEEDGINPVTAPTDNQSGQAPLGVVPSEETSQGGPNALQQQLDDTPAVGVHAAEPLPEQFPAHPSSNSLAAGADFADMELANLRTGVAGISPQGSMSAVSPFTHGASPPDGTRVVALRDLPADALPLSDNTSSPAGAVSSACNASMHTNLPRTASGTPTGHSPAASASDLTVLDRKRSDIGAATTNPGMRPSEVAAALGVLPRAKSSTNSLSAGADAADAALLALRNGAVPSAYPRNNSGTPAGHPLTAPVGVVGGNAPQEGSHTRGPGAAALAGGSPRDHTVSAYAPSVSVRPVSAASADRVVLGVGGQPSTVEMAGGKPGDGMAAPHAPLPHQLDQLPIYTGSSPFDNGALNKAPPLQQAVRQHQPAVQTDHPAASPEAIAASSTPLTSPFSQVQTAGARRTPNSQPNNAGKVKSRSCFCF